MEFQKKETLKIPRGEIVKLKLEKVKPFKEGTNEYDGVSKPWFGYNAVVGSKEFTYFASQSVHDIIMASNVMAADEFTLELRSERNKEGQNRSMWYLNGKNIYQYQEEDQDDQPAISESPPSNEIVNPDPTPESDPEPGSVDQPEVKQETFDQKNKIYADYINQVEINLSNAQDLLKKLKEEIVVPF